MKSDKNILIAFLLNLFFSFFEFVGGTITGSVSIISDSIHDLGDSLSIGISYLLERKSRHRPDESHTYGYLRYSVMGSTIITIILSVGSLAVIYNSILRIINPREINYNGMIIFAVIGLVVNFLAARITHGGHSLNERSVSLHMLEDVLGWLVVLIGAIVMRFTDISLIDPLMSIGVAVFILVNALKNLKEILDIFLEKTPKGIEIAKIVDAVSGIEGVIGVHHVHVSTLDGNKNLATLHVVTDSDTGEIKQKVKSKLYEFGISHTTVETESSSEVCNDTECENCDVCHIEQGHQHHNHHHHHHD
ncbi:MAG: cation diffusion facilitator family transporter [Acutalibacteraceae bacterium]|jgi:cobalt-zinc-cadmium efflux system protein